MHSAHKSPVIMQSAHTISTPRRGIRHRDSRGDRQRWRIGWTPTYGGGVRNRPDDARSRTLAVVVSLMFALVVGWLVVVQLWASAGGPSITAPAAILAVALAIGGALLAARLAVHLTARRPARVPIPSRDAGQPVLRAVDPDRPSSSRSRAPGCGRV